MTLSERHSADPALRGQGPKPTDSALPLERRTHAAPYLIGIAVVLLLGIALVVFGGVRFTQSTQEIQNSGDAVAPTEGLLPAESGNVSEEPATQSTAPAGVDPTPNATDVPGGN